MKFVPSPHIHKGRIKDLRVIVWHDMEAPEKTTTAEAVANYFANPTTKTSAHICADPDSVVECVKPEDTAWHAPGANSDGYGVELAGYSRQSEAEWLDDTSKATIHNAAVEVAKVMKAHFIPAVWLTDAQLADGKTKGMTTHAQVTRVFKQSTHTDPGAGFPKNFVLAEVKAALGGAPAPSTAPAKVTTPASAPAAEKPAAKPTSTNPVRATPAETLVEDGAMGPKTIKRWQQVMCTPQDGVISKPSSLIEKVQKTLNGWGHAVARDGLLGHQTIVALQTYLGVRQSGAMDTATVKALQHRLNAGRF